MKKHVIPKKHSCQKMFHLNLITRKQSDKCKLGTSYQTVQFFKKLLLQNFKCHSRSKKETVLDYRQKRHY